MVYQRGKRILTSCGSNIEETPPHAVQPYLAGSREHRVVLVDIIMVILQRIG